MKERDKFLTEAMGECWHKWDPTNVEQGFTCRHCGRQWHHLLAKTDFSTWQGFGKLWEWAQKQEWFKDFCVETPMYSEGEDRDWIDAMLDLTHPDRFASEVHEFLKGRTDAT